MGPPKEREKASTCLRSRLLERRRERDRERERDLERRRVRRGEAERRLDRERLRGRERLRRYQTDQMSNLYIKDTYFGPHASAFGFPVVTTTPFGASFFDKSQIAGGQGKRGEN